MTTLLERMQKKQQERENRFTGSFDPALYNLFDLQIDDTVSIRLLPGLDALYDEFWTTRKMVPMEFTNPADPNNPKVNIRFNAPCLEMYGPQHEFRGINGTTGCPLLKMTRILYKEAEAKQKAGHTTEADRIKGVANKHWTSKTTQYFYQGFVNSSPLQEKEKPENPIRIFQFVKKLHDKINDSIFNNKEDPFHHLPTGEFNIQDVLDALDADNLTDDRAAALMQAFEGNNLILKIAAQGLNPKDNKPYRDWSSATSWARTKSILTDEQLAALAKFGFHDLRKRLPAEPSPEKYERMCEMMQVSIARAFGDSVGEWNPEWEKPFDSGELGCTPMRNREEKAEGEGEAQTSKPTAAGRPSAASTVAAKLVGTRGKAEVAPVATVPAEAPVSEAKVAVVAPAAETPPTTPTTTVEPAATPAVTDVLANIRAKLGTKKPPATAGV